MISVYLRVLEDPNDDDDDDDENPDERRRNKFERNLFQNAWVKSVVTFGTCSRVSNVMLTRHFPPT